MSRGVDRLFERWCRRGDARALAALFDRTAPRLLRLGVHLAGDAAEAEDLVQATFVALIEQRERIDAARPAWPWLAGVLAHKASDARRRAGRTLGEEALEERLVEDASGPSERRELAAELARALDRLDEPYRGALVLRLRHGLSAAEIAHVLGRSPATVRVQLSRARELLKPLLPASLATGLALLGAPTRGLAAVRAHVMHQALASGAAATSLTATGIGVILVSQKLVFTGAALAAIVALVALWRGGSAPDAPQRALTEVAPIAPPELARSPDSATIAPAIGAADERSEVEVAPELAVRGRVTDAETGAPVEGATLRLFAPRELDLLEATRAAPELYVVQTTGGVRSRTWAEWPHIDEPSVSERYSSHRKLVPGRPDDVGPTTSALARFGRERVRVYGRPEAGEEPLAETSSDAQGRFSLPAGIEGGVLTCERDGYGPRVRAARELGREWDVALLRERMLEGVVVTQTLEPPGVPLLLAFHAVRYPTVTFDPAAAPREPMVIAESTIETLGVWTVECGPDGRFQLPVAAEEVCPAVLTPGWGLGMRIQVPVDRSLRLVVEPLPGLRVFDAACGVPIERVHLLGRETGNGYVRWSGVFDAPGGLLSLPGADEILMSWGADASDFVVWADGYSEARIAFAQLTGVGVQDVPLERGGVPALEGVVLHGTSPASGAVVALLGHSPLQWSADEEHVVDAVRADAAGGFRLSAPPGRYVLRAEHEERCLFELVELPHVGAFTLDLDGQGRIEVSVATAAGAPSVEHTVALQGDDGRNVWGSTDAAGRVVFPDLPPQSYRVFAPFLTTDASFGADLLEEVDLARGEARIVAFELPDLDGPRHLRVRGSTRSYEGWRARFGEEDWEPIASDGTLAQDLATREYVLEVDARDGRRWSARIPRAAQDGDVLELEEGTGSYSGTLRDVEGRALSGWRIYASPRESDSSFDVVPSVRTEVDGSFELAGLHPGEHWLGLRPPSEQRHYDYGLSEHTFAPDSPAGHAPHFDLWLPATLGDATLRGAVLSASGREPRADYIVTARPSVQADGGRFLLYSERNSGHARTDARGEFVLRTFDAPRVELLVYREWSKDGLVLEQVVERPFEQPIELLVP